MSSTWISEQFPLHWLVWSNEYEQLEKMLSNVKDSFPNKEQMDPRGRTPLHLAVVLGHLESARVLLRNGANANAESTRYWTVVQEAVATGDPELLHLCLQYRDYQRYTDRTAGVPGLLQKLREAPDFYVEMKWEFTSWVPLVSRMCPSDTYRVWKSGSNVRIDTTLLGFDNMNWQRGSRSYVFKGQADSAQVMEIDHDMHQVYTETMRVLPAPPDISFLSPSDDAVAARLTAPIVTTYIDTDKISFERSKSGIWGWRSDKQEMVNSYECKVFCASNVELATKTRMEHLTDQDKQKTKKSNKTPLESFLSIAEQEEKLQGATANGEVLTTTYNPCNITPDEYFDKDCDLKGRDIGRPIEQTTKTQKFKAQLWLSDNYPLSLQEQVLPIIDLMAASNAHFKKLRDFITLRLPTGFPVKIEIPLFHVLNARITFGNIFASESSATHVTLLQDNGDMCCSIEQVCFEAPVTYSVIGDMRPERLRDEDDELLQFAIQQSLLETGTEDDQVTFWEALNKSKPNRAGGGYININSEEERQLQRALEESMQLNKPQGQSEGQSSQDTDSENLIPPESITRAPPPPPPCPRFNADEQLRIALEMSQRESEEAEKRRKDEEAELERILQLSLTEK